MLPTNDKSFNFLNVAVDTECYNIISMTDINICISTGSYYKLKSKVVEQGKTFMT